MWVPTEHACVDGCTLLVRDTLNSFILTDYFHRGVPCSHAFISAGLALLKAPGFWQSSNGMRGFDLAKTIIMDQMVYFVM